MCPHHADGCQEVGGDEEAPQVRAFRSRGRGREAQMRRLRARGSPPLAIRGRRRGLADAATQHALESLWSGAPMSAAERAYFEPRFGTDFSGVRIHSGLAADRAAAALARAPSRSAATSPSPTASIGREAIQVARCSRMNLPMSCNKAGSLSRLTANAPNAPRRSKRCGESHSTPARHSRRYSTKIRFTRR